MGELRIIAGTFRRRRIAAPPTQETRPITDRVREALFSMLGLRLKGANVLDIFAGGGTMGLEAISRGAARCVFLDRATVALKTLTANIDALEVADRSRVIRTDLLKGLPAARLSDWGPFAVAFFDPPYAMWTEATTAGRLIGVIERAAADRLFADGAVLITRTAAQTIVPTPAGFTLRDKRAYGRMRLWWFDANTPDSPGG